MREILVDLHKTDAMLQINGLQYGHDEAKKIYYAQVLEKHGTTQAQFDSSLVWYTAHPQLFDKIYPKVLAELKKQEDEFVAQNEQALNSLPTTISTQESQKEKAPEPSFTRQDLDSIIWVTQHGYCNSWLHWERTRNYVQRDDVQCTKD